MAKIYFTPSRETLDLITQADMIIAKGKTSPFQKRTHFDDYVYRLGLMEFIQNETNYRKG